MCQHDRCKIAREAITALYFFSVEEGIAFAFSFSGYRSHFNKWGVDVCVCDIDLDSAGIGC